VSVRSDHPKPEAVRRDADEFCVPFSVCEKKC
jgi:hypothetical protein